MVNVAYQKIISWAYGRIITANLANWRSSYGFLFFVFICKKARCKRALVFCNSGIFIFVTLDIPPKLMNFYTITEWLAILITLLHILAIFKS